MIALIIDGEQMETIPIDEHMKKLYEQINKHYKTINRELVNKIVHRFNEIIDLFYDFIYPKTDNEKIDKETYKDVEENKNSLLVKRILRNKELPEAATFDIVINLVDMVFQFMSIYDHNCIELFDYHIFDKLTWLRRNIYEFNTERKYEAMFNDSNIPSTMERFFNISDKEIWYLLMLNYPEFKYEKTIKWRVFDGIRLPYPVYS